MSDESPPSGIYLPQLKPGAFSLAQALASHSSRSAKEKLAEVRTEQRELLEVMTLSLSLAHSLN